MAPDDLTRVSDEELYALERQRAMDSDSLARIDDELRRRRDSRRAILADSAAYVDAARSQPTLGDLERVAATVERAFEERFAEVDARFRRLKFWIIAAPFFWMVVGIALWYLLSVWGPSAGHILAMR